MNDSGTPEPLDSLYTQHRGRVTDKWSAYLQKYDEVLSPMRSRPIRLLEVGVQNGGSLEIWSRYFSRAEKIVGCDINPKCSALRYDDSRIELVIGDANSDTTQKTIATHSQTFDIVIDDGSHQSADIITSFAYFFSVLSYDGIFIIEDLHCSYWERFGGGLYNPYSSMSFFKRLLDVINGEHWGLPLERRDVLAAFEKRYNLRFEEELLSSIHSIEFANSMCIIRKRPVHENELGHRKVVGIKAEIENDIHEANGTRSAPKDESGGRWALSSNPIEEVIERKIDFSTSPDGEDKSNAGLFQMSNETIDLHERINELERELKDERIATTEFEKKLEIAESLRSEFDALLKGYKQHVELLLEEIKAREKRSLSNEEDAANARQAEVNHLQEKVRATEERLQERFAELATVSRFLREQEDQNSWLRQVAGAIIGDSRRGRLIGMLPEPFALALRKRQLKRRGLFDPQAYYHANPDVADAGGDPLRHYILHGLSEGRTR